MIMDPFYREMLKLIMLSFLCSCGEHYNPFGRQHGGPEDSDRVR